MMTRNFWLFFIFFIFNCALASDATNVNLNDFVPNLVVTLGTGYFELSTQSSDSPTLAVDLPKNMVCPTSFKAYVSMVPYKEGWQSNYLLSMYAICVQNIALQTTTPPHYQVTYLIGTYVTSVQIHWAHVRDYDHDEDSLYGSNSDTAYVDSTSRKAAYCQTKMFNDSAYGSFTGVHWTLFCYPPNITPPVIPQTNCVAAVAPYIPSPQMPHDPSNRCTT